MKATDRPWKVIASDASLVINIVDGQGNNMATIHKHYGGSKKDAIEMDHFNKVTGRGETNYAQRVQDEIDRAAFIVQCVNAHEALMEACKTAEANLAPKYPANHIVMQRLRAALKLAGE